MSARCTPTQLALHAFGRREIAGRFDAGRLTSDGGAILLRELDRRLGLMRRSRAASLLLGVAIRRRQAC